MNRRMIAYILGKMMGIEGLVLLIPAFVSLIYREISGVSFLVTTAMLLVIYFIFGRKAPENKNIYGRDGMAVVGLAWILWSAFGALPFFMTGYIPNYIDALFETISGFTTTGSTILTDIEGLPMGLAFWRCFTQWIGGMGVLMFVMALTSLHDDNAMHLMRAEVPGPETDKLVPKARNTAKILYGLYFALTAAEVILLLFGGMSLFDALIHSFTTAGTGGFSNKAASIAYYDSAYIDGVITVFMILFGVNFNLYYLVVIGKWKDALKNGELQVYLCVIGAAIAAITVYTVSIYGSVLKAFRYSAFQVASIISTTGYATTNYDVWPEVTKTILLGLMVIGACSGSTGGGAKVSRFMILIKSLRHEIRKMVHPKAVTSVRINGSRVSNETIHGVYVFMGAYVMVLIISTLIVSFDNYDFTTSISAVLTTLNNVGPGLSAVGPEENFAFLSIPSKIVLSADMLIGRLAIFPVIICFTPVMWKK